jgi:DNA-binding NtrC family response regulator
MTPLRIAYLDDEAQICELFIDNFASHDVSIITFTEPEQFITFVNESHPDLVLLDFRLPHMTGEQVAARLHAAIPKALVTGDLSLEPCPRFTRVFYKPFDFDEMGAFIQSYR